MLLTLCIKAKWIGICQDKKGFFSPGATVSNCSSQSLMHSQAFSVSPLVWVARCSGSSLKTADRFYYQGCRHQQDIGVSLPVAGVAEWDLHHLFRHCLRG